VVSNFMPNPEYCRSMEVGGCHRRFWPSLHPFRSPPLSYSKDSMLPDIGEVSGDHKTQTEVMLKRLPKVRITLLEVGGWREILIFAFGSAFLELRSDSNLHF
jgi:hypothetical protein